MVTYRRIPPPDTVAYARRRYLENAPAHDIVGETGLSLGVFYRCLDGWYDDGSGLPVQPLPRRNPYRSRRPALSRVRATMLDRLWRTGESYVRVLEDRLARSDLSEGAREGDARVFAIMVRAMRELGEVGASVPPPAPAPAQAAAKVEDDAPDREIELDEFRRDLIRQMDAIVARRAAARAAESSA